MAILPVVKYPEKVLTTRTRTVERITDQERRLVRDMIDTMYAESGVGLAANQVGVSLQIFVASADQVRGKELVAINPVIIRKEGVIREFEGCLSIPEFYEPVKRSRKVRLRALDLEGRTYEMDGEGLLARIFQHEIDHLNGVLFVDRLGPIKSRLSKSRLLRRRPRMTGGA
ncbi:MAG: Peptide deformylase [Candidatus Omnitrophica bacterium]|nr:Peptide deformylase [Candidatus Omnitrophota bacterium]